jgi:flagellar hook protein FlgE
MAINGTGFFVVEPPIGQSDGEAIFAGSNFYTRRGDFELDKSGYLVNGAGYYLKGLPIDPVTQNISGSVPQVLKISNAFLPAQKTTNVNYELNLPQQPKTAAYQASPVPGNELLSATDFLDIAPDAPAEATGAAALGTNLTSTIASDGDTLTITVGATSRTYSFTETGGTSMPTIAIHDAGNANVTDLLAKIQQDLRDAGATGATVGLVGGKITVAAGNVDDDVTITDGTTGSSVVGFGLDNGTTSATVARSTALAARVDGINADQAAAFISQSISGGAITVYAGNGAPANVQMRWAKVNSVDNGGADRWNLYVMTDANATGDEQMWTRIGGDYTFGPDGSPAPAVEHTDLPGLTVNGVQVGDVRLQHGAHGLTEFADPNGTAEVTTLNQNGYAAGQYVSVSVNDNGRAVVSYSNGQQLEVAQVVTANFNAVNQLKRLDGGVFAATSESGEPIFNNGGGIIGSSLEASNTDISEEFTKLIVTQQAYAAGTRIVSTADQMLQDALNMLR